MTTGAVTPTQLTVNIEQVKKQLTKTMFKMYQEFPFWAFLLEKCNMRVIPADSSCTTACVNAAGDISFNEKFISNCSESMTHFVLAHEVMHLLLGHFSRRGARDPLVWNIAGDILINNMLDGHFVNKGIRLDLTDYCTAQKFNIVTPEEITIEEVYDRLMAQGKGKVYKTFDGEAGDMVGSSGGCGGSDGTDGGVAVRPRSEDAPAGAKEWAEAGLEAATRSILAGNCPGFMQRMVDNLNTSKVPWKDVLAYYLRQRFCQARGNRHTFTPPNRRYLYQDIILTSRIGAKKPKLAFSIDTSGSMSPKDIAAGISEMDTIRRLYKVDLYLIECDYSVHKATWVKPYEPIPAVTGGGGTSFVPVMQHIKDKKIDVDVVVMFTDGYGDFGAKPDVDVIWVMNSTVVAPYGTTLKVD